MLSPNFFCYNCNKLFGQTTIQTFSCNHNICYICLSQKIILDELSPIENKQKITINCFCQEGRLNFDIKELNEFLSTGIKDGKYYSSKQKCSKHHSNNIVWYCTTCEEGLCEQCVQISQEHMIQNGVHQRISITEYFETKKFSRPYLMFETYQQFENFMEERKKNFNNSSLIECAKTSNHINELIKRLNDLKIECDLKYQQTKVRILNTFDTLKLIYKIFYSNVDNEDYSISKYKTLNQLKKDLKSIEFIPDDLSQLEKIENIIEEFNQQSLLNYKFDFFYFNFKCVDTLKGHNRPVLSLCQTDCGSLASGSEDQSIRLWNVLSKEEDNKKDKTITILKMHKDSIFTLLNGKDDTLLSAGRDDKIIKWDIRDYDNQKVTELNKSNIFEYYPNKSKVKREQRTKAKTQYQVLNTIFAKSIHVYSLIELSNGNYAYGGRDETIKIYDSNFQKCLKSFHAHENTIFAIIEVFSDILASGSADKTIRLWKVSNKERVAIYNQHTDEVHCLLKLNNGAGKFASASGDSTIRIFSYTREPSQLQCLYILKGHTDSIVSLIQLSDYRIVSGSCDFTIRIWDLRDRTCTQILEGHKNTVFALYQLKDGRLASGSADKTIKLWGN